MKKMSYERPEVKLISFDIDRNVMVNVGLGDTDGDQTANGAFPGDDSAGDVTFGDLSLK